MPYGVLQCIRELKSFVARRVAGSRGLKGVSTGATARGPDPSIRSASSSDSGTDESEFDEFADISQPESTNS